MSKTITVNNQEFESISAAARFFNVSLGLVYKRLKQGMPIDKVFTTQRKYTIKYNKKQPKLISQLIGLDGKAYKTLPELAKASNISVIKLCWRLFKGMTVEQAIRA